ncbi:MAG: nucleoside 2-deoxyribosyltransferase [Deltaproteobacteria bacterium]|nr:nucleoside 2-deoxyribosyltransferase [Deltaproteobacteria bacterium]
MGSKIKIYVASPLGFSEIGRAFYYRELIPRIEQVGYQVIDPWTLTPIEKKQRIESMTDLSQKLHAWKKLNIEIGRNNKKGIDDSDGLVAVLDGTDVDSGTAAEIGYAFAKGKPILGYRGDFRLRADNEVAKVNLQVEYFIQASGGTIITEIDKLQEELKRIFG